MLQPEKSEKNLLNKFSLFFLIKTGYCLLALECFNQSPRKHRDDTRYIEAVEVIFLASYAAVTDAYRKNKHTLTQS